MMVQTLPFDNVLPHLRVALDPNTMKHVFSEALLSGNSMDASRFSLESCDIGRVKYKPGKNCLVYYHLRLRNNITQQQVPQILCARLYPEATSRSRYERAKQETLVKPNVGQAVVHIPSLEMVVWAFPNDRKLQHASQLMDSSFLQEELLPQVIAAQLSEQYKIVKLRHELVHYAPEHTCTVRAELQLRNTKDLRSTKEQHHQSLTLYGKTYYNDEGAETYRLMQLLWNSQARKHGLLNVAKPLRYHPEYKMLWQQGLSGNPLITLELQSAEFSQALRQVARTVATLHQTPLSCSRKVSLQDWQTKLSDTRDLLQNVRPEAKSVLEPLVKDLQGQAKHLGKQPNATLHGDLHLQNFLIDHGTLSLIDLDNLCQGSPWQDVGSFIAGLYYRGLLEGIPVTTIQPLAKIFCEAYALASSWKLDTEAIRWYSASALIAERAYRTITRLKSGRLDILDDLIELANQLSSNVTTLNPVAVLS
jgi:aminoglycoside phosphotransferase (APT) family kinase protein